MKWDEIVKKIIYIILIIFVLGIVYSVFIEPKLIKVNKYNLYLPNYQSEHNGLKVVVMSDFHIGRLGIDEVQLKKIVNKVNKQNADFIFLLGDYDSLGIYYSKKVKAGNVSSVFSDLKAKYGVYSVMGNHDYDELLPIAPIIKKADIKVLEDGFISVNVNSKPLNIYGLRDFWHYDYNAKLISKTKKSVIVLTHNPDTFPLLPDNISLALAGHTHGGQIYFPFIGGVFCSSIYEQRYLKGYIVENNKHLYVTSGIGNIGPMRFGNIPEIAVLTLYSQNNYPDKIIINTKPRKGISNLETIPLKIVSRIRKNYKPKLIKVFGYI